MAELYPFEHDWSSALTIRRDFDTEVIVSRNGRQQRIANRLEPRYQITVKNRLSGTQLRRFENFMARTIHEVVVVKDDSLWVVSDGDVGLADTLFPMAYIPPWIVAGQYLVADVAGQNVLIEIDSLGAGALTVVALTAAIPAGTRLYRAFLCTYSMSNRGKLMTNTVGEISMEFDVLPGTVKDATGTADLTHNSREVFLRKPNWKSQPSIQFNGFLEMADFGRGRVAFDSPISFMERTVQLYFTGKSSEMRFLESFMLRQRGPQGDFYMPTRERDVDLTNGSLVGATSILVPGTDYYETYNNSTIYRAVFAEFNDGSFAINRIAGLAVEGLDTRITFTGPFAKALNRQTTKFLCHMPVWRCASDEFTIDWLTSIVGQSQITFQMLEDL